MTSFKERYDQKLKDYDQQLRSMPSLTVVVPELSRERVRLFLKRTSDLLGQIDKGRVRRPAHLVHGGIHLAEAAIQNLDSIPSYSGDAHSFVQQIMSAQVEFQRKLEFAVGLSAQEFESIRQKAANEIKSHLEGSEKLLKEVGEEKEGISQLIEELEQGATSVRAKIEEISLLVNRGEKFRERLELLDGDARRSDSLEKLLRSVKGKVADVEQIASKIPELEADLKAKTASATLLFGRMREQEAEVAKVRAEAERIIGLSSQAGLANSYLKERSSLAEKRTFYNCVFYIGVVVLAITAAFYVLPVIESAALVAKNISLGERALLLVIRSVVLAPMIWALVFTSSRIKMIEALEIDYAEKAAASLAYHGYKSEMEADSSLLERLKSGLLLRFSEHPERLLRKNPSRTEGSDTKDSSRLRTISPKRDKLAADEQEGDDA